MPFYIVRLVGFVQRFCVLSAALGSGVILVVGAQPKQSSEAYKLTVTADRADAIYQRGETVTFTVTLTRQNEPADDARLEWSISKDGVAPRTSGWTELTHGTAVVTSQLYEPGFLQCRVSFPIPEKPALFALAGAAIDPLQIKPSLPAPDDFDAYWAGEKNRLAAVPMNPCLTPVEAKTTTVEAFDLQADCVGAPVSGYFARPAGAKSMTLPIILTVQSASVRSSNLGITVDWAQQGFLAMDINPHGIPNGRPEGFYNNLAQNELKNYWLRGRESREGMYFHDMFMRMVRALDFLTAQPEWDRRTVVISGMSQGGYQAIVAAGLDPRVTFFAAAIPAGCDHTGFKVGRVNGWPKFIATGEEPAPDVLSAVRYYDAVNFATRTKAAGILTVGFIDVTCPPTSVYAAYNALRGEREIFPNLSSGHANPPRAAEAIRRAIMAHVATTRTQ